LDNFLDKLESADYLEGYSSAIFEVAKRVNDRNISSRYRLKMIKGTSEKIFDSYQVEVKKAFGKKMVSEYGAAEAGIIAFECPRGAAHINMETVILEEIEGMAVVTNLVSDSFPIIRYALGDAIQLRSLGKCDCGMQHEVVFDVLGRVGQVIYGHAEKYPSLTLYYVFKNLALTKRIVLSYQGYQNKKGEMDLRIEGSIDKTAMELLGDEIKKYFGSDLNVRILPNSELREPGRKMRDFISEVADEH
jgi:phenylacetate-CoA ligase